MYRSLRTCAAACLAALFLNACGGGGGSGAAPVSPPPPVVVDPPPPTLLHAELVAGQPNTPPRYANGTLATAGFNNPAQLAFDKDGNLYVSDADYVVRKITPSGQVSLLAGSAGHAAAVDGNTTNASFMPITGMAIDAGGNVYVSSATTIRKITPAGVVLTFAGTQWAMGTQDGPGSQAGFWSIQGMTIDAAGNLYVADYGLRRVSPSGNVETIKLEQYPTELRAVALDPRGGITVTDGKQLLRYDMAGKLLQAIDMTDRTDVAPGTETQQHYTRINAIAYTADGTLYAVDTVDYASASVAIRMVDPSGKVTTLHSRLLPAGLANGPIAAAHLGNAAPGGNGLLVDKTGNLLLADASNHAIRKISPGLQVSTFAGGWAPPPGFADGIGATAAFGSIAGFGTDKAGNYYVADRGNCEIRKISPAHEVTTLAGIALCGSIYMDGVGDKARFQAITAMTQAADGSLYVTEKTTVRKVALDGTVSTIAGTLGTYQKQDGTGSQASFQNLNSIAVAPDGTLLVSDGAQALNGCNFDLDNAPTSLRAITTQGAAVVTTLPGTEWLCGQRATAPAVWSASDLAFDGAGKLYLVSGGYLGKRTPDGTATWLLDSQGAKIAANEVVVDDSGTVFFVYDGAVFKYGADHAVTKVLAPTISGAPIPITPDVAVARVSALTYIGNHKFVASFDQQVVVVTLK
ncbi:hypothetical protein GCM10027321_43230 [Massilia terrae]|uniref:Uncharacterized protein n=1 Tax=Massilia terrae TaxID=1811224 RepID=A0ABT2D1R9_9BURK|nr:hypothetical protein [Massilia terrae]MCS0660172.1 hypothetical protein [Massilia terrae]